jgi:MYXO-CTERM domain-containing protein
MCPRLFFVVLIVSLPCVPGTLRGQTVFTPGADQKLDAHMLAQTRMFHELQAYPLGIGLTAGYANEESLQLIRDFLAQDESDDVAAVTGKHPYELISGYEGPAGIGLRGGGAAIATAFRYMALKEEGASTDELVAAREDVVRAIEYIWIIHVITGIPHGIARGAMLMHSEHPDEPPIPHGVPELTPLFDGEGNPLPPEKTNGTDRPDNSGGILPEGQWYWVDSCSKDQLVGWVAAMATLYDAAKDDPDIDPAVVEQLQEVARAIGEGFRIKYPFKCMDGKTYDYDLVIMDADGRPSQHHDLNPLSVELAYMPPGSPVYNVFNLIMGLGIVKGLYHVSGDPEAEVFIYEELLQERGYLDMVPEDDDGTGLDYVFMGADTNHSNVNMISIALFLNVYFEKDPDVLARMRHYVEHRWWDVEGVKESVRWLKQPYFHAFYEAMTVTGTNPDRTAEAAALLKAFALGPYLSEERMNCDDDELAAGSCLAIDGKTEITLESMSSWGDHPVADEALDPSIRPPSNFDARSNPFQVNGGGGSGLNPGGDLISAYWLLRYLPVRESGAAAQSPNARDHIWFGEGPAVVEPAVETSPDMAAQPDVQTSVDSIAGDTLGTESDTAGEVEPKKKKDDGCSAGTDARPVGVASLLLMLLCMLAAGRRRKMI